MASYQSVVIINTESSKYYMRIQTAVARDLGLPAARLAGLHRDTALLLQVIFRVDVHAHRRTFAKRKR